MLPRSQRLNLKTNFKRVAAGKKMDTKYVKLFLRVGSNLTPRVGIAISSTLFKKASQRNRARRLISAAFEALYPKLPRTINIIALPKQSIIGVKSKDVLLDLAERLTSDKIIT